MFSQKIEYFAEEPVLSDLKSAFQALFDEVSSEKAMNFDNNVEIFVDEKNLQDVVKSWVSDLDLDVAKIFLDATSIKEKLESKIAEQEEKIYFSIQLEKSGNANTLFNTLFAREITISPDTDAMNYEDYDYCDLMTFIEDQFTQFTTVEITHNHVGGDADSNTEYLDFNYDIEYKE
jgi:hypothetical protein